MVRHVKMQCGLYSSDVTRLHEACRWGTNCQTFCASQLAVSNKSPRLILGGAISLVGSRTWQSRSEAGYVVRVPVFLLSLSNYL